MKFETLTKKQMKVLLTALDYDSNNLNCDLCNKKIIDIKNDCCVMPALDKKFNASILCSSTLCMSEYISLIDVRKQIG